MAYYHDHRHGSSYGNSWEVSAFANLLQAALIILIVLSAGILFVLFRCGALMVRVMSKQPHSQVLWISLSVCLALGLLGLLLALSGNPDFIVLAGLGLVQFLITCKVVENTQLSLREKNVVQQIVHPTSWWSDYNA